MQLTFSRRVFMLLLPILNNKSFHNRHGFHKLTVNTRTTTFNLKHLAETPLYCRGLFIILHIGLISKWSEMREKTKHFKFCCK